jgi:hypothetical protein
MPRIRSSMLVVSAVSVSNSSVSSLVIAHLTSDKQQQRGLLGSQSQRGKQALRCRGECAAYLVEQRTVATRERFDSIPDARQFIQDLRTKFPLPTCDSLERGQEAGSPAPGTPPAGTTTKAPANTRQPSGTNTPATPTGTTTSVSEPPEPDPGVNCRNPREGGG